MSTIESRLADMGITIPEPPKPVASYVGYVKHGDMVFVSGQTPMVNGKVTHQGLLGRDVSLEDAVSEAQVCAINILAQIKNACDGDLERIVKCIRLGGFVASTPDFTDHPKVVNGASDFMGTVLGERGEHSRAAVGVAALPLNCCVEVDAIFAIG
ncbi:MAG: RidA family protein [Pseudomonadota bacterium]